MAGGGAVENEGALTPGQDGGREHTGVGAAPVPSEAWRVPGGGTRACRSALQPFSDSDF